MLVLFITKNENLYLYKTTYEKEIDYEWLYRITKALKLGAYVILYKEVLGFEIDESELRISIR